MSFEPVVGRRPITRLQTAASHTAEQRKKHARSKVTNGTDGCVLPNVDGRSLIARRFRDISSAILADQGGESQCSESKQQLIRRFAAAAVLAENMEAKLANGEQIDISEHALLCSTLVRVARQIGVRRIPRDVTLDLYRDVLPALNKQTPSEAGDDPD